MSGLTARIVAIGDELLEGRTSDTNSTRIQRALAPYAVAVRGIAVVPDAQDAIAEALDRTAPGDLVLVCGGLGSTADDLTREAVASWAGAPLQYREDVAAMLAEIRRRRGHPAHVEGDKQTLVPAGLEPVANPVGTAPALVGRLHDRRLVLLPGVPAELQALLPPVLEALQRQGALPPAREGRLWRTAQMAEMAVARATEPVRARYPQLRWSWWLVDWGVDVRLSGEADQQPVVEAAAREVDAILGDVVYAREPVSLPRVIQDTLQARGQTLAVAESCTGGLLGAAITGESGSSGHYLGGVLSYADAVKSDLLMVDPGLLARVGAVSGEVAGQMARGARVRLGADWAVAVTGIAGPGGGTAAKPVGTTWIAIAGPEGVQTGHYRYGGDRERNRRLAMGGALDALRRALTGAPVFASERLTWGRP
jgi:nicotinamide-nucleotide amidase